MFAKAHKNSGTKKHKAYAFRILPGVFKPVEDHDHRHLPGNQESHVLGEVCNGWFEVSCGEGLEVLESEARQRAFGRMRDEFYKTPEQQKKIEAMEAANKVHREGRVHLI